MRFIASEIAAATSGHLSGADVEVDGVVIDSRLARGGELFVPIVGERDGHRFVPAAFGAGAAATLAHRVVDGAAGPVIEVADTGEALLDVGRLARRRLGTMVVGVTGSVGKTGVKDLAASVLAQRWRTAASERSFNNELGVPLTLANAPDDTEATVVEMGARGIGHVALLCDVAHPTVGIVTRVAVAHAEQFGSLDQVAQAKGELVEALPAAGTAVLNADDARVAAMAARTAARVVLCSTTGAAGADVVAEEIVIDDELRPSFLLRSPWGDARVRMAARGAHQVANALAAAPAGMACGVAPEAVAEGLAAATASPWRMDLQRAASGALILNDAYNANPASMEAALRAITSLGGRRRIAVLGLMAELGADGAAAHRDVLALADELGIDVVVVDTDLYGVPSVDGIEGALAALGMLGPGDAVLVKGSRVAGLERLAQALLSA